MGWNLTSNGASEIYNEFGSFDILPSDTQSIIVAQVIARGSSNLNSITKLRELSDHVQSIYDNNFQSVLSSGNNSSSVPNEFSLHQNYPNPFNPSTTIEYDLPTSGEVVIIIYDVTGREVRRIDAGNKPAGNHKLELNADGLSSGTYLCKAVFSSNSMSTVKSMRLMLIR
ncbi:MAG: T9SS type A sorting domain-containing protein [Ignavibacteria bacterium]|nr:T9SS type A sorting domain-containing protein [Ignavibacteria bacterium]